MTRLVARKLGANAFGMQEVHDTIALLVHQVLGNDTSPAMKTRIAPTAIKAQCTDLTKLARECTFLSKPVCAGPFVVDVGLAHQQHTRRDRHREAPLNQKLRRARRVDGERAAGNCRFDAVVQKGGAAAR